MLRWLVRTGFRRGLSGSRPWLAVGFGAGALQLLARMARREEKVVYLEELRPGQSLVIQHFPRPD